MGFIRNGSGIVARKDGRGKIVSFAKAGAPPAAAYVPVDVTKDGERVTLTFTVPSGKTVRLITADNNGAEPAIGPGPAIVSISWVDLGNPGVGEEAVIEVAISGAGSRSLVIRRDEISPEEPRPVAILGDPVATTSGIEGDGIIWTPPIFSGDATIGFVTQSSPNSDKEAGPFTTIADITAVPTYDAPDYWISRLYTVTPDDGSAPIPVRTVPFVVQDTPPVVLDPAPTPFVAGDYLAPRCEVRPSGQTTTFSPIVTFPNLTTEQRATIQIQFRATQLGLDLPWHPVAVLGGSGPTTEYMLPDAFNPATPTFNEALWIDDARRTNRLRFRHRFSSGQEWATAGPPVPSIPLPAVTPPPSSVLTMTQNEIQAAMSRSRVRFFQPTTAGTNATGGQQSSSTFGGHIATGAAYAAYQGYDVAEATPDGLRTPVQRTIQQLEQWAAGNLGTAECSYSAQHEFAYVSTIAIAKMTPAVWDALTTTTKTRLTWAMRAAMIGAAWAMADKAVRRLSLRGFQAERGENTFNFGQAPILIVHVCAHFLGVSAAQSLMNSFDRASFAASLQAAGGLTNMYNSFTGTWDEARRRALYANGTDRAYRGYGTGPNAAELASALNGWACFGLGLTQTTVVFQKAIEVMFSKEIKPGITGQTTGETALPEITVKHGLKGSFTNNILAGCIRNKSDWKLQPNQGEMHMCVLFDTSDGGDAGGPNRRSSLSYAMNSVNSLSMAAAALSVQGAVTSATLSPATKTKFRVGMQDIGFKLDRGYQDYSKGGVGSGSNNGFFDMEKVEADGYAPKNTTALARVANLF